MNFKYIFLVLSLGLVGLSSCKSVDDEAAKKAELESAKKKPYKLVLKGEKTELKKDAALNIQKINNHQKTRKIDVDFKSSKRTPLPKTVANITAFMEKLRGKAWMDQKIDVGFDVDVIELRTVIKVIARQNNLDFKYIIDPEVKGSVEGNFKAGEVVTRRKAWELFEYVLWLNGAYISAGEGGYINIFPLKKMPKDKNILNKLEENVNVAVAYVDLRYLKSSDAISLIKPFLSDGATINALPNSNSLLIVDAPLNINKIQQLLAVVDRSSLKSWPKRAFACENVNCSQLQEELSQLLPILGLPTSTSQSGKAGASNDSAVKLLALERTGMLVIAAPTNEVLDEIENWIYLLDKSETGEQEQIFTYPVKHGSPERLLDAISAFFSQSNSSSSSASTSTSSRASGATGSKNQQTNTKNNRNKRNTSNNRNRKSNSQADENDKSIFATPVTIFQDLNLNKLILKTTPRAFAMIEALMSLLDQPASQVLIQVTAVNVNLDKSLEYGFSYAANQKFGDYEGSNSAGNPATGILAPSVLNPAGAAPNGLSMLLKKAGTDDEFAFIRAVAGDSNTELLFTPQLVTGNGNEATLKIVQEVPYSRGTTQNNNDTSVQNIEYRETGVTLTVTPYITADGRVTLDIKQEISSIADTTVDGIDSPVFNSDSIETQLTLDNNDTFLLGGMITTEDREGNSGVPYLKDIPYLGFFFKGTSNTKRRRELILLVKPQIIDNVSSHAKMLERYEDAVKKLSETEKDWK